MTKRKLSKEPTPGEQREEKGGGERDRLIPRICTQPHMKPH